MSSVVTFDRLLARGERPRLLRWLSKLYVQILIAIVLGGVIGALEPSTGVSLKILSDVFLRAIKLVVTPIIFCTVALGLASMGEIRRIAIVGVKSLLYFEVMSTLALLLGMLVGNLWPVGKGMNIDPTSLDASAISGYVASARSTSVTDFIVNIVPSSLLEPFVSGNVLAVLFIGVLFGLALCGMGVRAQPLVTVLDRFSKALFGMVRLIMWFAPLAALGAIAFTVGKFGFGTLLGLGQLVLAVYVTSALFIVLLGVALRLAGFSLARTLSYFKEEILIVFAATAAETMIPRSMEKLERLGVKSDVTGLVMPAGFSFNMDGTAIYMSISILFIAHATNTHLSWAQQCSALFVMLFTSKGAAGVTGGGFIALAATMPVVGTLPVAALTLLIGVDRFMAAIRAASNLTSNIIATLVVGRWVGGVDPEQSAPIKLRTTIHVVEAERAAEESHHG